jgi:hypothetical protein
MPVTSDRSIVTPAVRPYIVISDWKPYEKNSLRGFFTATLPSGLVFHKLMLHERNGARWIAFPAREWVDAQGKKQFARFIEFTNREAADRFRDQVLAALDRYLETQEAQP